MYPPPIQRLLSNFAKLPGVGPRTAERFVFHLLTSGKKEVAELAEALQRMIATVRSCETCFDFSDASPCALCRDRARDAGVLCIVAEPADLQALERSGAYRGRYFVLRGTIDPTDDEVSRRLKLQELFDRCAPAKCWSPPKDGSASGTDAFGGKYENCENTKIEEIILAFNPDVAGETTMLFLERRLRELRPEIKISRLARGLPMGSDLRYADDITLGSALKHRTQTGK